MTNTPYPTPPSRARSFVSLPSHSPRKKKNASGAPVHPHGDRGAHRPAVAADVRALHRPAPVQGDQGRRGAEARGQDLQGADGEAGDPRDRREGGADGARLAPVGFGRAYQGRLVG